MRVRGIFIVEKLLFQLIEMLGGNERTRFVTPQSISNYRASVLVQSKYIFLNFSFPFTALRISFQWAALGVIYQGK